MTAEKRRVKTDLKKKERLHEEKMTEQREKERLHEIQMAAYEEQIMQEDENQRIKQFEIEKQLRMKEMEM